MDLSKPKRSTCPRLSQSRSRRPLSADDVPMLEELLSKQSLNSQSTLYANCSQDSGFLSDSQFSPCSTGSLSRVQGDIFQFLIEEDENQLLADETAAILSSTTEQSAIEVFKGTTRNDSTSADQIKKFVSMDFIFSEISEELGHVWERLGRHLLKRECLVRNIDKDFNNVEEKAFQVLLRWKREQGPEATIEVLMASLVHVECAKVAESLLNYLDPSQLGPRSRTVSVVQVPAPKIVYNVAEDPDTFMVQRRLSHNSKEKVLLWTHSSGGKKYVIREIDGKPNVWTARKVIDSKALQCQKLALRKTKDFIKDLQAKERMVKYLLGVVEHLQNHLSTHHSGFCQKGTKCQHCPRVGLKKDLIQNELALLHHELQRVITAGNRRISVYGIPTDRIYSIAERTYTVCEEHKELHQQVRSRKCSDTTNGSWDEDEDDERIEKSLKCTLNIMFTVGRRRKSVQSLKPRKQNKEHKKVKRNKSTFYVPLKRESYLWAQDSPVMIGEWDPKDPGPAERNPNVISQWEPRVLQDLCETTEKTASLHSCQQFDCNVHKLEKFRERRRSSERFTKSKTPTRTQSCSGVAVGPQISLGTPSHASSSRVVFTRQSFPPVQGSGCTPWSRDQHEGGYGELLLDEVEDPPEGRLGSTGEQAQGGELGGATGGGPGSAGYATGKDGLTTVRSAASRDSPTPHVTEPTQSASSSSSSSSSSCLGVTPQHKDASCRRPSMKLSSLQDIQWMQDLDCSEIICV